MSGYLRCWIRRVLGRERNGEAASALEHAAWQKRSAAAQEARVDRTVRRARDTTRVTDQFVRDVERAWRTR